jgi:heme-degrading monooxygenase HmoA
VVVDQLQALIFLEYWKQTVIPAYEFADGLVWIDVYERTLGAHEEVLTISLWRSEQDPKRFALNKPSVDETQAKYGAICLGPRD